MITKYCFNVLLTFFLVSPGIAQLDKPGLPEFLPRDLEIELALSAAPKHLKAEASVYVLGENGYELAREGSNGWTCLVIRGPGIGPPAWDDMIAGWCYDEEGMNTIGKAQLDRAALRRQGIDPEQINNTINAGFASGKYRAPAKAGIIYMLSPVNQVPDHRTGKLMNYLPHVMYYAPFVGNDDIGVPETQHIHNPDYIWSGLPYIPTTGPHGFIVQPLGEKEAARIVMAYREMIEKIRKYIDLELPGDPFDEGR